MAFLLSSGYGGAAHCHCLAVNFGTTTPVSLTPRLKIILHDLAAIALAWGLALFARFNFALPPPQHLSAGLLALPVVVAVQAALAWRFGLYRGLWRFASLQDLWNIIRATVLGTVCIGLSLFLISRLVNIPRSMFVLYPLFLVFLLGGPRLAFRLWKDHSFNLRSVTAATRVLVVGGGEGGEGVVRDMLRDGSYLPVGIVDDDARLARSRIHGVSVLGRIDDIPRIVERRDTDIIIIAIPSASSAQMRHIVERCEASGKPFRTLPQLHDMVSGRASMNALREVKIDDLLGRDKVVLDWARVQSMLAGKVVLVSGGGGSIGSELCRQLVALGVGRLVVFEQSEHNLYLIERELRATYPQRALDFVLGDVCDQAAVEHVFARFQPALVLHAAAYKHVPILQTQAREAVRNNVFGTLAMVDAAERHGCAGFVLISTDKAVRPSSIMGATKRLTELLCEIRKRRAATKFITVRFGNVLGSAGSVVPLFQTQIATGGPVTVTHPDARRYFMTIAEASQLILQAATVGSGGEIFVLDMGEPVNITYLAEQMIRLSGCEPGVDVKIVYTGLRPGEKLNEELFLDAERLTPTPHHKIQLAQHVEVDPRALAELLGALARAVEVFDEVEIERLLREAVPELGVIQPGSAEAANVIAFNRGAPPL